jgi:hypothetical protein
MLEPDLYFSSGKLNNPGINCNNNLTYFDADTKTWNCPWDVNSKSNWLITDGTQIIIDTSLAPSSTTKYSVQT